MQISTSLQGGGDKKHRQFLAVLLCATAALALAAAPARADDAQSYLQSARQLEKEHNLRGAEIQLRNAAQVAPGDGTIRLELAKLYLAMRNPNAAEAELFAAHMRGVKDDETAPLMGQSMLALGAFGDLLKNLPAGNRSAKIESVVRSDRGMAEMGLGEIARAHAMFADAERLDPTSPLPLVGEARLLMQQRQYGPAQQKIGRALQLDPKNGDAMDAEAMVLALRGNTQGALRELAAAIAADPGNLRALLDRANVETELGRLDDAEKDLAAVGKIAPGSVMALYLQATIDAEHGKLKNSDALLDRLRGAMSSFPPIYLLAAEVKFKLNELGQAEGFARKYLAQAGGQPKAYQLLGAIALKRGDLEQGIAALENAAKLAPRDSNVLAALGQAYVAHGDLDKAKAAFAQAAASAPGNAPLATQRALADFATGAREQSVASLGAVFRGGKGSVMAGPPLVIEALQIGQLDVAEAAARELVARDAKNPTYQELLAAVRIAQHDYAGAEALLTGLLSKHPELASARRDLAQIYLQTNRLAEARKLYQDRLDRNPKDVESLGALADIALRGHDEPAALKLLTQAQKAAPSDPRPSLRILAIIASRKEWPQALGFGRAMAKRFGHDPRAADALGQLYYKAGNASAAMGTFKAASAKFPTYAPIFAHYAAVLAAQKNYAAAAPLALRAARLDPREVALKSAYVTFAYLAKGEAAAMTASRSVSDDKSGQTPLLMTAAVMAANDNRAGAIALLEKEQAQRPSSAVAMRLAFLYWADKRLDQGLSLLKTWTAAHPGDVDARFALAQGDSQAGRLGDAFAQYQWLAAQRPDNPVILNNLAYLYDVRHDARARPTAEKAMKLAPSSGSVADTLGWILEEQGDAANAAKYLAQASASQPTDATIQYHYAVALSKIGKAGQARDVLQKMLRLNAQPETKNQAQLLLVKLGATR